MSGEAILRTVEEATRVFLSPRVSVDYERIAAFEIPQEERENDFFSPPPYLTELLRTIDREEAYRIVHTYNALNASLQYCFFSACSDIRFDGIDSQWVIRRIDGLLAELGIRRVEELLRLEEPLVEELIDSNITMLRSRVETVREIFARLDLVRYGGLYTQVAESISMLSHLICFRQDPFFKKGLFAVMMTGRMLPELKHTDHGFAEELSRLPVPADYRIPAMLRHYGLIRFDEDLDRKVQDNTILVEGSEEEMAIRAATVEVVRLVAERNGMSCEEVDAWLFAHRKECSVRHHLCLSERY